MPRPSKQPKPATDPDATPSVADAAGAVQVKVWLLGISPMVWRRLLVPDTCTLRELHGVIQVAMGWEGIRATFPRYYLYVAIAAALGGVGLIWHDWLSGAVLLAVALVAAWLRQGLTPTLNRLRDAGLAGNAASNARFDRMHRVSVYVNMVQMVAVVARVGLR